MRVSFNKRMGEKKIKITIISNDYVAESFFMGDTFSISSDEGRMVHSHSGDLPLLPSTTIWEKRGTFLEKGKRQLGCQVD